MSNWPYPFCPHQLFNKSLKERLHCIPYTIFPDPTIDAFTNLNVKSANIYKSSIPTVAYERYFNRNPKDEERQMDTNFVKDYYMETIEGKGAKFDNNIVNELKDDMAQRNAYVLAGSATKEYEQFENKRKNALLSARNRAKSATRLHLQNKQQEKEQRDEENATWLRKLCRKLEQIARHIVQGDGQSLAETEKKFLLSKTNLTAKYLSQIKIRNPKSMLDILQELRILMMKKKLKFADAREEQDKNKSVSMSMTSQASQNTSQGSMLSEATSLNQSNIEGEQEIVKRFCDFDELKKKWKVEEIQDVKYLLRLALTRQYVSNAQLDAVKKRRQAEKINAQIESYNLKNQKTKSTSTAKKVTKSKSSKVITQKLTLQKPIIHMKQNHPLSKQQQKIKQKFEIGSQFDAIGDKLSRNRNYSKIVSKRAQDILFELALKKPNQGKQSIKTMRDPIKQSRQTLRQCIQRQQPIPINNAIFQSKTARQTRCLHQSGQTLDNSRY